VPSAAENNDKNSQKSQPVTKKAIAVTLFSTIRTNFFVHLIETMSTLAQDRFVLQHRPHASHRDSVFISQNTAPNVMKTERPRTFVIVSNYVRPDNANLLKLQRFFASRQLAHRTVATAKELLDVYSEGVDAVAGMVMTGSSRSAQTFKDVGNVTMNTIAFMMFEHVPKLCICFSHQLVSAFMGAKLREMPSAKCGSFPVAPTAPRHRLFAGIKGESIVVKMSHRTCVQDPPANFRVIAVDSNDEPGGNVCKLQGLADDARRIYTVQFHPEALPATQRILDNFVVICFGKRR
jgi:GMP synthase-like glutamine amidotransferase